MNPFLVIYWRMCSNKTKDIPRKMTGAPGNRGSNRKRRKEDPQNDAEGKLWDVSTTSWGGTSSNQLRVWSRKTNPGRQPTGRKLQLRDYDVFITLRWTWGWITQKHPPKYTVKHTRQLLTPRWGEDVLESKYNHSTLCIQTGFPGGSVVKKKIYPPVQEVQAKSLDQEDPLEKEMAAHSSIFAWKIPQMEEPGRL